MATTDKPIALQSEMEQAVSSLESFLNPQEEEKQNLEEEEIVDQEETEETEDLEDEELEEEESEEDEEELEEESEESELEETDEEQTEVEQEIEEPALHAVKVNGVEIEVTLEELINGYSRQQDYTRKTQKVAEKEQTLDQMSLEVEKEKAAYAEMVPKLKAVIAGSMGEEPDWAKLSEEDPYKYVQEKERWDRTQKTLDIALQEEERLKKEQEEKFLEEQKTILEYSNKKILEVVPEWKNADKAQSEKASIKEYAVNVLGYTDQEIDMIIDYRALHGLREAWLNHKTKKAVKKKPKEKVVSKVAKPGTVNTKKSRTRASIAKKRLAKSGKVQDAAKVFENLI